MSESASKFGKSGGYPMLGVITAVATYICVSAFENLADHIRIWTILGRSIGTDIVAYAPLLYLIAAPLFVGWKIGVSAGNSDLSESARNVASYAVIGIFGFAILNQVFFDKEDSLSSVGVNPSASTNCTNGIESRIDGQFNGWDGDTVFRLVNGQVWQQQRYAYKYHYSYRPSVTIVRDGAFCKLVVQGLDETVQVQRIR